VVRVALVALFAMDAPARWCDVLSLSADVALHRLQDGRLNPPGTVAPGLFLGQKVEIFGCLLGQTDRNYGFSLSHGHDDTMDNNKHFLEIPIGGCVS